MSWGQQAAEITRDSYHWLFRIFSGGSDGKGPACNVEDPGSIPGLGIIPWRRACQPSPVFLPGESQTEEPGGLQSMASQELDMTE